MNMIKKLVFCVTALSALPAFAGTQTWDFTSGGSPLSSGNYGNSISMDIDGITLTVTGWSDTNGQSNISTPETIEEAALVYYGDSLGLINRDEDSGTPNHSIDSYDASNGYGNDYDVLMLTFNSEVTLDGLDIGWAYENYVDNNNRGQSSADITTLAYTGTGSDSISGSTWQSISTSAAWSLVQNSSDVDDYNYHALTNKVKSTTFLIGAYNPLFGSDGWSSLNDGFKLAGITTKTTEPSTDIPEPATLGMFLLGLVGVGRLRKKVR